MHIDGARSKRRRRANVIRLTLRPVYYSVGNIGNAKASKHEVMARRNRRRRVVLSIFASRNASK